MSSPTELYDRIKLAHLPTPVHGWNIPGVPEGFRVFIKRDDLTGSVGSGNKVRKLEFILAEANRQGCKHVITAGGINSNHCRSTAIACAQVELECHLIITAGSKTPDEIPSTGNMLLNKLCGAKVYLIPDYHFEQAIWPPQFKLAEKIREKTGEKVYLMPLGGSDKTGSFGYIEAYNEMLTNGQLDNVTDIISASGTGGTISGFVVANHLAGNSTKIRIHAVRIVEFYSKRYLHDHCNEILDHYGISDVRSEDVLNVMDDYLGPGYDKSTDNDLDLIQETAAKTGIILDPTYTAKAAQGLVTEMQKNPIIFKGNRVLFIHTGGIFGAMDHSQLKQSIDDNSGSKLCTLADYMSR